MRLFRYSLSKKMLEENLQPVCKRKGFDLNLAIEDSHFQGTLSLTVAKVPYSIDFEVLEVVVEGDGESDFLVILMDRVPEVQSTGGFLHKMGTGLANYVGRFLTMESVKGLLAPSIPGLLCHENDLMLELFLRASPSFRDRVIAWFLGMGVSIRAYPKADHLEVEIHFNYQGNSKDNQAD